jgi:ornithine cyclodeaminase/alanine dehydrogenase-like protein (mu-crystallin family)
MRILTASEIDQALTFPVLIDALAEAFAGDFAAPERHHHGIDREDTPGTLLLMPAWTGRAAGDGYLGVKVVSVFPGNGERGLPSVLGTYLLMDGGTGLPLAALDGTRLTVWRTAAASALAEELQAENLPVRATVDLEAAVRGADLVSCATLSQRPLVKGEWLKPGAHLDLVGAFNLTMREADDEALRRSRLYVDTAAARHEGGDVALALRDGAIMPAHVLGDLFDLCRAPVPRPAEAITVFKSVGAALEDLAAAMLVWRRRPDSA